MIFKDYYKILGLNTNKVTIEEIKVAYREQAKKYHPDVNIGNSHAEERFKDINEAYKVLSDINSKRKYDRMWNSNIGRKKAKSDEATRDTGSVFSDFFNLFFGANNNRLDQDKEKDSKVPVKGENIETQINISIEEGFYGAEKKISLRTTNGKMKTFTIKIPKGIRNHERIRLLGQGKKGKNGGKNGDLLIHINIQDSKLYKLDGYDIRTILYLTPWEAVLGTRVSIKAIDEEISIIVPQGITSGENFKIPQKGYLNGQGGRGDFIAEVKIMVPKKMTEQEKELFIKLNDISSFDPRRKSC
jgi:curved DNA-binding protein